MAVGEKKPPKEEQAAKPPPTPKADMPPWEVEPDGSKKRTGKILPRENKLKQFFLGISGAAELAGDQFVSSVVANQAPQLAYGWAKLAQENPRVALVLDFMLEGSAVTEALLPTVTVAAAVAWHFGYAPDKIGAPAAMASGVMPMSREVEQKVKAEAAREMYEQEQAARKAQGNGGGSAS